ncbi:MAG: hypothetical protein AAFX56_05330 [Pseudomonadota bacterium]
MQDDEGREAAMIAGMTVDEHDALRLGLRTMPETMPPRVVWERLREQADAEGLLKRHGAITRRRQWYLGGGIAAAAAMVAVLLSPLMNEPAGNPTVPAPQNELLQPPMATGLTVLRAESSRLEGALAALPGQPSVLRAGTAATIADVTDRIAAIDFQLSDPTIRLTAEEQEIFWRERVRLMKLLVKLRTAQAQRTAF